MVFAHSHFSFLRGSSSPEELTARCSELGISALCLVDYNGVYGAVRLQKACKPLNIKPLIGCTVNVGGEYVRIIAKNAAGYAEMNALLTELHAQEEPQLTSLEPLTTLQNCYIIASSLATARDLTCVLTSDHVGFLANARNDAASVFLGVGFTNRPGERKRNASLVRQANECGIRVCIAPDVRYACKEDYAVYDAMTCIRLGITIFDPHVERPVNDAQHLRSEEELRKVLPYPEAFANTQRIIDECSFDILPGYVTPPSAQLPDNTTPEALLNDLCYSALPLKYSTSDARHPEERGTHGDIATGRLSDRAKELLKRELDVICSLGLADFFLVVKEIIDEARRRNIRCSGRGSAANSIVAYLLGITGVCPIRHHLLFERFLHRGRKGMPDIDVDFDSDRRNEIIAWMEQRFGTQQTAMTATLITYRARMAVRDAAKALGFPMETVNRMSKAIPGYTNKPIHEYADQLTEANEGEMVKGRKGEMVKGRKGEMVKGRHGDTTVPIIGLLLRVVEKLLDRPRHLGLHSGGMILSAKPLNMFTPVQRSANGVSVVQFDKDDVEAMGLVKFDVLGLRMLACISEAEELIVQWDPDFVRASLEPFDDPKVFELIRSGNTLGVFQIESQGQMHLLAQHQPETFDDLVTEVALFRPGPLQGGMVNPYVRRRRGQEPVTYLHPDLEPLLKETLGIVLFQEQVLEIAHHFAGMPLDEADDFRALVSKNRDAAAMQAMHTKFVQGAMNRGVDEISAEVVYETVSHFVGYGFCRSHAAAFAKIVYHSAWLKVYYPAEYMAAFMQHRPGMYNLMTLEEEAKRLAVPILLPDINESSTRYTIAKLRNGEKAKGGNGLKAILKPLTSIKGVTEDIARKIVWERALRPFASADDLVQRVELSMDLYESIAVSGALDGIEGNARTALWTIGLAAKSVRRNESQQRLLPIEPINEDLIPKLPKITAKERLAYDYITHGAARVHPMTLYRRVLNEYEVRTIETAWSLANARDDRRSTHRSIITVGGIVILRQSPPTAHGVLFVTIEDETGFVQCVVQPKEREMYYNELRNAALIVKAEIHAVNNWRGLLVREVRVLNNVIGGYYGHPVMYTGLDKMEVEGVRL